jgi:hypothetical protein
LSSKKREREKKQRPKEKKDAFAFLQKNTLPYQVWGRCNEEETVRDKERKERKERKQSKAKKGRDKKKKTKGSLGTDRPGHGPALLWLLFICLFICNQMVGVGFCLVQFSESLGTFFWRFLIFGAFSRGGAGFWWIFGGFSIIWWCDGFLMGWWFFDGF